MYYVVFYLCIEGEVCDVDGAAATEDLVQDPLQRSVREHHHKGVPSSVLRISPGTDIVTDRLQYMELIT